MPEQEPGFNPEEPTDKEVEKRERPYTREQLLEGMIVASVPGVQGPEESAAKKRLALIGRVSEILDRYKFGIEPDFEYLAETINYAWNDVVGPEFTGRSAQEAAEERAELTRTVAERESEFVKAAYERLTRRRARSA